MILFPAWLAPRTYVYGVVYGVCVWCMCVCMGLSLLRSRSWQFPSLSSVRFLSTRLSRLSRWISLSSHLSPADCVRVSLCSITQLNNEDVRQRWPHSGPRGMLLATGLQPDLVPPVTTFWVSSASFQPTLPSACPTSMQDLPVYVTTSEY